MPPPPNEKLGSWNEPFTNVPEKFVRQYLDARPRTMSCCASTVVAMNGTLLTMLSRRYERSGRPLNCSTIFASNA